jgi:hypothetical protein
MSNKNTLTGLVIGIMTALLLGALALPVVSRATGSWPDGSTTDAGAIPKNLINSPVISTGSTPHVIPAAAFRDDGISDYFFSFGNGYIRSTGSASACLMAPVYLPDGILMDYLRIYAYDNHAANFTMELRRKENSSTSSSQVLASVTTSGSSSAVQKVTDTTIGSPVVDNRNYSYFLSTCLNSTTTSHRFYAAELGFRFFTYLPAVLKDFCGGFPGPRPFSKATTSTSTHPRVVRSMLVLPTSFRSDKCSCIISPPPILLPTSPTRAAATTLSIITARPDAISFVLWLRRHIQREMVTTI